MKESLEYEFRKYGDIRSIKVVKDNKGDQVAYATFRQAAHARACKTARGFLLLKDRQLHIEPVYDDEKDERGRRSPSPPPPRRSPVRRSRSVARRSRSPIRRSRSPIRRSRSPVRRTRSPIRRSRSPIRRSRSPIRRSRSRSPNYNPRNRHGGRQDDNRKYNSSRYSPPGRGYNSPVGRGGNKHRGTNYPDSRSRTRSPQGPPETYAAIDECLQEPEFFAPSEDVNATRTLFVGNLEQHISDVEIEKKFEPYGFIENIDLKRSNRGSSYCFVRYGNLDMAYRAKISLNAKMLHTNSMQIGYGKIVPSVKVWVGGLGPWTKRVQLEEELTGLEPSNILTII